MAQKLYQSGHITYLRTEAKKYSQEFLQKANTFITTTYGDKFVGCLSSLSNEGDKLPHEAIRVTNLAVREVEDQTVNSLYKLIWRNTVESCMSDAQFHTYKVTIDAPKKYEYIGTVEVPVSLGWMHLQCKKSDTNTGQLFYLQSLAKKNAPLIAVESKVVVKGGNKHYTASGLIQKLEELEIGRPSTYAMFVDTLLERGYVKCTDVSGTERDCTEFRLENEGMVVSTKVTKKFGEEKNKLVIQPTGTLCVEFLRKHFEEFFAYSYTKKMEEALDKLCDEESSSSWKTICDQTYQDILRLICPVATKEKKMTVRLDEFHEVVFQQYGPVVRKQVDEQQEFLPIKENMILDMDKLKNGGYSVDDLVEYHTSYLGEHDCKPVHIKKGTYGMYVECGEKRKSTGKDGIDKETMTLEGAVSWLYKETILPSNTNVLRVLDNYTSVRKGKFGPYL